MAKVIEAEGSTVDEAVEAALDKLGVDRTSVEVEVIEEGNKGFFGRLSQAKAKVRVSLIEEGPAHVVDLIKKIMDSLDIEGDVEASEDVNGIKINISGSDIGLLIGKQGETLAAIQSIVNIVVRKSGTNKRLEVDVENYRGRRAESLKEMAEGAAEKALRLGKPVLLKPMNSYERRMIHVALQGNDRVHTSSEGEEPNRQVRISPK